MGMRLVISVKHLGEDVCKIYYHWSAYTMSALYETRDVINCIYNHEDETKEELQLRLIRFCEENGGGISGDGNEFEYIQAKFPNETFKTANYSRNNGLIALSENGMIRMAGWSEGDVDIDIDEDMVSFGVYSCYENLDEYNAERLEWDEDYTPIGYDNMSDIGIDLGQFATIDIDYVINAVNNVPGYLARNGNEIFELIC